MGWLDDILGNLGKAASNHEELLGAIPLIAGSALLARNGRAGGPIGAGLTALGGLMEAPMFQHQAKPSYGLFKKQTGGYEYLPVGGAIPPTDTPFQKGEMSQGKTRTWVKRVGGKIVDSQDLPFEAKAPGQDWTPLDVVKQQDVEANRASTDALKQSQDQALNAYRQASLAQTAALRQATLGYQQSNADFMHQIETSREEDQQQRAFDSATQNLAAQRDNITKMSSGANPSDPNTLKTLIARYNAQAASLAKRAAKFGVDPGQFAPLDVGVARNPGLGGAILGRTHPVIKNPPAATPTATDPRTGKKVKWDGSAWVPVK